MIGPSMARLTGVAVAEAVADAKADGWKDGIAVGMTEGATDGVLEGSADGEADGVSVYVGLADSVNVGISIGFCELTMKKAKAARIANIPPVASPQDTRCIR